MKWQTRFESGEHRLSPVGCVKPWDVRSTLHAALPKKSVVCSGCRVTSGTGITLLESDNRGGITVKTCTKSTCSHIFILQILIILTTHIYQVKVNPPYFKVTSITSDKITWFGHDNVTKTRHESLWQKQWVQRRTFAVLHFYMHGVGDSVHWVLVFY